MQNPYRVVPDSLDHKSLYRVNKNNLRFITIARIVFILMSSQVADNMQVLQ